jgi:hypothetical protein
LEQAEAGQTGTGRRTEQNRLEQNNFWAQSRNRNRLRLSRQAQALGEQAQAGTDRHNDEQANERTDRLGLGWK